MPENQNTKSLEIDEDFSLQEFFWKTKRVGWIILLLLILAALAGLFQTGLFSQARQSADSFQLEYHRFERISATSDLRVDLPASQSSTAQVWLSREYLENHRIEQITPQPESVEASGDRYIFNFKTKPNQPSGIMFHLIPENIGYRSGEVGVENGQSLKFSQFVYP